MERVFRLTTAQFAKLHNVNRRTLHYYDNIGLFSPGLKGSNQYRYYDSSQSIDFEYIRMLKDLNMSLNEIKAYVNNPNPEDFLKIINEKSLEIEQQVKKLKQTQKLLWDKKVQIELCSNEANEEMRVIVCDEERFLTVPYTVVDNNVQDAFFYIKNKWGIEQCRAGVGSYISADKVLNHMFEKYDGMFTPVSGRKKGGGIIIKPKGNYLCAYMKGSWDHLPETYQKMIQYAEKHCLELTGYAYERGMNDFVVKNENEYITQIMIGVKKKSKE